MLNPIRAAVGAAVTLSWHRAKGVSYPWTKVQHWNTEIEKHLPSHSPLWAAWCPSGWCSDHQSILGDNYLSVWRLPVLPEWILVFSGFLHNNRPTQFVFCLYMWPCDRLVHCSGGNLAFTKWMLGLTSAHPFSAHDPGNDKAVKKYTVDSCSVSLWYISPTSDFEEKVLWDDIISTASVCIDFFFTPLSTCKPTSVSGSVTTAVSVPSQTAQGWVDHLLLLLLLFNACPEQTVYWLISETQVCHVQPSPNGSLMLCQIFSSKLDYNTQHW